MAGTHDGDRWLAEKMPVAAKPEYRRRIKDFAEPLGIHTVGIGNELASRSGKGLYFLVCRCARMSISNEMHALDWKFQSFEIGKTTLDHFCG